MVKRFFRCCALLLATGCHLGYDLDLRDMGADAGYFVECYCTPGEMYDLTATRIAPIADDQYLDYSLEFETWITADERFRLWHSLYHDGPIVYNYASDRRLDPSLTDSVWLDMQAPDGSRITAATAIPPQARLGDVRLEGRTVAVSYHTEASVSGQAPDADRCFILGITVWGRGGRVLADERYYRDLPEATMEKQTCRLPTDDELGTKADSIVVELKRMTRAGYRYQLSVKEAQAANRDPLIQPPPLDGNIAGAQGIFTCYTRDRHTFRL